MGQSTSVVPFVDCLHPKMNNSKSTMHAWELILKYYETKNGDYFNSTPARKLSQSFNLDIEGCKSSNSHKQVFMHLIYYLILSHLIEFYLIKQFIFTFSFSAYYLLLII